MPSLMLHKVYNPLYLPTRRTRTFSWRMRMLYRFAKRAVFSVISASILFTLPIAAQQPDPSARCKYQPDPDPPQIGPGTNNDNPYNFAYVSDFNRGDQNYRRRICDESSNKNDPKK